MDKPVRIIIARGVALFVGALFLIDVVLWQLNAADALSAWWVSNSLLPTWLNVPVRVGASLMLLGFAVRPQMDKRRRVTTELVLAVIALQAFLDTWQVWGLHRHGIISLGRPPLSLLVLGTMVALLVAVRRAPDAPSSRHWIAQPMMIVSVAGASAMLFAWGQMSCFGGSDYRRPAQAVVVFGARVYRDGAPSLALADRVRTAARLVREGYAPLLIVSGGPGDGDVHEVEAMRDLAIAEGVAPSAIVLDRRGLNTRATAENTHALLKGHGPILAVSHGYHLPRIKLSFQQVGIVAYTVPAKETRVLIRLPYYMAREALAFWAHAFHFA